MDSPSQGGSMAQPRLRIRTTVTPATLLAAAPLWGVGGWFGLSVLGFLADRRHRVGDGLRGLADWPWVEALAWSFSVLLPLSMLLARALHAVAPGSRWRENATAAAILGVLTLTVWWLFAGVDGSGWFVLGFLVLALARWVSHEGARRSTREHFEELARAKTAFVKLYSAGVAGFLLCGLTCVPLLALAGPKLDDVGRQTMLMVLIGMWYFVLTGTLEIVRIETTWKRISMPKGIDVRHGGVRIRTRTR